MRIPVRRAGVALGAAAVLLSGGCGASGESAGSPTAASADQAPTVAASSPPQPSAQPPSKRGPLTGSLTSAASPVAPTRTCADEVHARLSQRERIGQLLMVAASASAGSAPVEAVLREHHVGGVLYLGGWRRAPAVSAASAALQAAATNGVALLVAADQEGGQVQQLRGEGFSDLPTAVRQGEMSPPELTDLWTRTGEQLAAAGVNLDLAPVADVVAPGTEPSNAPIGRYRRHYGTTPAEVSADVTAVVTGLARGNVTATVKHFPGLGRVSGNTDVTATGITDAEAGPDDANLEPFRAGIAAGAGMVMVSSARYPRLDPHNAAVFSPAVIDGLLRQRWGYAGVVVSDDVGIAASVAEVPVGDRATRFLAAGGDIVLTAEARQAPVMVSAVEQRAQHDPRFAQQVDVSARRVLALKEGKGLLRCG